MNFKSKLKELLIRIEERVEALLRCVGLYKAVRTLTPYGVLEATADECIGIGPYIEVSLVRNGKRVPLTEVIFDFEDFEIRTGIYKESSYMESEVNNLNIEGRTL